MFIACCFLLKKSLFLLFFFHRNLIFHFSSFIFLFSLSLSCHKFIPLRPYMKETYDNLRLAIRNKQDSQAFLRLGECYAQGLGTLKNPALACYFFKKAIALGCEEARVYLDKEYDLGSRNIVNEINGAFMSQKMISDVELEIFKSRLEIERKKHNYGVLCQVRTHLHHFYPDYAPQKAMDDILMGRDTVDADLFYATKNSNVTHEVTTDILDRFMEQIYAPFIQDGELYLAISTFEPEFIGHDELELRACVENMTDMYDKICEIEGIRRIEILRADELHFFPYLPIATLILLRRQALRCLLSLRSLHMPLIEEFIEALPDDGQAITVSEIIKTKHLQAFLILYIELNLDIDTIEKRYQHCLQLYREGNLGALAQQLNESTKRLELSGICHTLPEYTSENLPPIIL